MFLAALVRDVQGMELASTLRRRGCDVVVLGMEQAPRDEVRYWGQDLLGGNGFAERGSLVDGGLCIGFVD